MDINPSLLFPRYKLDSFDIPIGLHQALIEFFQWGYKTKVLILAGDAGVGKTQLAKAMSHHYNKQQNGGCGGFFYLKKNFSDLADLQLNDLEKNADGSHR